MNPERGSSPSPFAGYRYLSAEIPGMAGRIKERPEDFVVEEVPAYEPSGEGTHLYLYMEKRRLSTREAIRRLASELGRRPAEFGYAGMKDAVAVARQWISIEHMDPASVKALAIDGLRVLRIDRHRNKLKVGHLRGNRFRIAIRGVEPGASAVVRAVLDILERRGVPNYYGVQRFGRDGEGHLMGRALILGSHREFLERFIGAPGQSANAAMERVRHHFAAGEYAAALEHLPARYSDTRGALRVLAEGGDAGRAAAAVPRGLRQLFVSAYQSCLFNLVLSRRLPDIGSLLAGDLAFKHANGACFLVDDPASEQHRVERFEISPSGPIFGYKMTCPEGETGALEAAVLAAEGLQLEDFRGVGKGLDQSGARRPLRVPLREVAIEERAEGIDVAFLLPKGTYATTVLDEVFKTRLEG